VEEVNCSGGGGGGFDGADGVQEAGAVGGVRSGWWRGGEGVRIVK